MAGFRFVPTQQRDQPSAKNADATNTVPGATGALPVGWSFGMTVREVLELAVRDSATILAGEDGLDRIRSDAQLCFAFLRHAGLKL